MRMREPRVRVMPAIYDKRARTAQRIDTRERDDAPPPTAARRACRSIAPRCAARCRHAAAMLRAAVAYGVMLRRFALLPYAAALYGAIACRAKMRHEREC